MPTINDRKTAFSVLLVIALALVCARAFGHAKGEDYVFINVLEDRIEGEFQVNVADLREKLGIDVSGDEARDRDIVRANESRIYAYIRENFSIGPANGPPWELNFPGVDNGGDFGEFIAFPFYVEIDAIPDKLTIRHEMYYEDDWTHRGLLLVQYNAKTDKDYGAEHTALIFNPSNTVQDLDLTDVPRLLRLREMVFQGMKHIWFGLDHILFLLALILPAALIRSEDRWIPVDRPSQALRNLLAIITVFTVSHSITLFLSAFDLVQVSGRIVEPIIALSIVLVALNNIFQWLSRGALIVVFGLGLFHGLGFATVMGNLPFRMVDATKMVLMFNVGVEIGQVLVVLLFFPLLYRFRTSEMYVPAVVRGGSLMLVAAGGFWFYQRTLGLA